MTPSARTTPAAAPPASTRRGSLRFAAGLFVAGALIALGLLLLTGQDSTPKKAPVPPPARLPKLTERFRDRSLGVSGLTTRHWVVGGVGSILHLVSTDRKAIIAIGAPGPARTAQAALHVAIATIRSTYKSTTLKQAAGATLGGLPARSVVMYATNRSGARLRILLASAHGRKVAYLMQVFTASNTPLSELEEAQEIVAALRFSG